jgi:TRAP transporter TAXI family solute receptor
MNWYRVREATNWIVIIVIAVGILLWAWQQDQKKETIVIAAATQGGYFYKFARQLATEVERVAGDRYDVDVRITKGSVNNSELLRTGEVDVGIIAIGSVNMQNLQLVAPLFHDYAHLVVRNDVKASDLRDFTGIPFSIGRQGSGNRSNATNLLNFFNVDISSMPGNERSYSAMETDSEIRGAIVTTTLLNPTLNDLLYTGKYRLMSLNMMDGFTFNNPFYVREAIPAGVYQTINGPMPAEPIDTISTMAVLASGQGTDDAKIRVLLEALESTDLLAKAPILLDLNPIEHYVLKLLDLHPVSEKYYNPNFGLDVVSQTFAMLDKFKEIIILLLILGAASYARYNGSKKRKEAEATKAMAAELYEAFSECLKVERTLREVSDIRLLKQYQNQILNIKQKTVDFGSQFGLQTNDVFLSVINECNEISRTIQQKLQLQTDKNRNEL